MPGTGSTTETVSNGKTFGLPSWLNCDVVAAHLQLRGETVLHAEERAVPDQIGVVADHMLLVGDKEAIAVDGGRGAG